ncbi:MAG: carboxylating nicotinate-nucleotide diphosphorylase [Dehalococcoidia bacterium]|nr:carboxylating nicotinate-nucleotide diphosphorylase [Dehalococcoidia bacterium]
MRNLEQAAPLVQEIVDRALAEDAVWNDVTTAALIQPGTAGQASFLVKGEGVLAGLGVARMVLHRVDPALQFRESVPDGARVRAGEVVASVQGAKSSIIRAERVALNFLQRLSGIATQTAAYVAAIKGTKARIVDTRKTTPGLRLLEKYAVSVGGGFNHRINLADGVLVKDNHLAALRAQGVGLREAIEKARRQAPHTLKIEVEVTSFGQAAEAIEAGAEALLLDNMPVAEMRRVAQLAGGRLLLEASGGITLVNVREVAETGVDLISVGALTHSVKALDISLELA